MAIQEYPKEIPNAQVLAAVRTLGIDPQHVISLSIETDTITLEVFDLDEHGNRQFSPRGEQSLRQMVEIRMV